MAACIPPARVMRSPAGRRQAQVQADEGLPALGEPGQGRPQGPFDLRHGLNSWRKAGFQRA